MKAILCRHIHPTRTRCHAVAPFGELFCAFHLRRRERAARRKAQPRATPGSDLFLQLGPSPSFAEVQAAFGKVLQALAANRIAERRATLLLRQLDRAYRPGVAPATATPAAPQTPAAQRSTPAS